MTHITLDQARALVAVASCGTVQAAAESLRKGHSAVLYLLRGLEDQVGVSLFDRSGYRNQLTKSGRLVLRQCEKLLSAESELISLAKNLKGGWEPSLKLIYDGVVDFNEIATAIERLDKKDIPTELTVIASFLHEVELDFESQSADIMVTVLPIKKGQFESRKLQPIELLFVGSPKILARKGRRRRFEASVLENINLVVVKNTTESLGLGTEGLQFRSRITVNDFPTKREALVRGLGLGWMPRYLIEKQLKAGELKIVDVPFPSKHILTPRLYYRNKTNPGRALKEFLKVFEG